VGVLVGHRGNQGEKKGCTPNPQRKNFLCEKGETSGLGVLLFLRGIERKNRRKIKKLFLVKWELVNITEQKFGTRTGTHQ